MFKVAMFDLDGTLANTLDTIANSGNYSLIQCGFPIHSIEDYKQMVGTGARNLVINMIPETHRDNATIDKVSDIYRSHYRDHCLEGCCSYLGTHDLIKALKDKGYKLSVLSNKPQEFTLMVSEYLYGVGTFDICFGERDSIPKKPDPTAALEIANFLDVSPNEIVYFGDSGTDMQTAKSANMYAVGVLWGFRDEEELIQNGADMIIASPMDFFKLDAIKV